MTVRKFSPIVSIVGFHHAKGPDVEHWFGGDTDPEDTCTDEQWPFFPFMALYDGSHSFEQDFSYFTLKREARGDKPAQTLFAISCTRQLDARLLLERTAEVTRSTVQKAVVVITENPIYFGHLREQLSMVTKAWFAQRNFEDLEIIKRYQESLVHSLRDDGFERETHLGLSLRDLVHKFKHNALVLLKCALLQPKMLFFSSKSCEKLCMTQFSLVSLIPGLLENLQDASDPEMNTYETNLIKPTSLKSSDRKSLLTYMGCPLQIFGKGSLFGPYTPLQQLDILADKNTTSYIVGSTNSLLLQQKDRYSDVIINLDDCSVTITSTSLRNALTLTAADRRWIDALVQTVIDSWDDADPDRPKGMSFTGSEDFIRMQFEEYILSLLSSVKYSQYLETHANSSNMRLAEVDGDPISDFGVDWVHSWKTTENYRIFQKFTEPELFDVILPRHVCAGGLTFEDVSRRINQQLGELKLDEKVQAGKTAVARTFANGSRYVSSAFSSVWADLEAIRETRRKHQEEQERQLREMERYNAELEEHNAKSRPSSLRDISSRPSSILDGSELGSPKATSPEPVPRSGTFFSSWASWAGEKRKKGLFGAPATATAPTSAPSQTTDSSKGSLDTRESLSDREKLETEIPDSKSIDSEDSVIIHQRPVSMAKSDYSENGMRDFRDIEDEVINDNNNDKEESEKKKVIDDLETTDGVEIEGDEHNDHNSDHKRVGTKLIDADFDARQGHTSSIVPDLAHEDK